MFGNCWGGSKILHTQTHRHTYTHTPIPIFYVLLFCENAPSLLLRHSSFCNLSVTLSTSQVILEPFRRFNYVTAHSRTFPSLYLRHSSFSNHSVALTTSQLILQSFRHFTYVTAHSPRFRGFNYVIAHSPTFPSLHLHHSSFSNPSVALPTSKFIFQLFFRSPTSQALHLIHLASRPWKEPLWRRAYLVFIGSLLVE